MEIITNPERFIERHKDVGFAIPLLIILATATLSSVSGYISAPEIVEVARKTMYEAGMSEEQIESLVTVVYYSTIATPFIMTFITWLILTLIVYIISSLLGGSGEFSKLLKLMAFGYIPEIILSPASIYLSYESSRYLLYGLRVSSVTLAQSLLNTTTMLWSMIYWMYAVKYARELPLKRSFISAGVPVAIAICLNIISIFLLSATP